MKNSKVFLTEQTWDLGCGNPQTIAELKEGETFLNLGSGGGFDCFLASPKVGSNGLVIGVDMTPGILSEALRLNECNTCIQLLIEDVWR